MVLGGEPGTRLSRRLAMPVSGDSERRSDFSLGRYAQLQRFNRHIAVRPKVKELPIPTAAPGDAKQRQGTIYETLG
nr:MULTISPECIES: hypothetical protein [unclassified Methylobacterium]